MAHDAKPALADSPTRLAPDLAGWAADRSTDSFHPSRRRKTRPVLPPHPAFQTGPDRELRALLRRRLLIVVFISLGFFGVLPLLSLRHQLTADFDWHQDAFMGGQWAAAAVIAGLGLVLWRRRDLSLRALRGVELGLFGAITLVVAWAGALMAWEHHWLRLTGWVGHPVLTAAGTRLDPVFLRWFAIVVTYGTLIPNTWRRCACVVGGMTGTSLAVTLTQAAAAGAAGGELALIMVYPVMWMGMAAVVATFGSYRLSLLERQVYEARKLGQYRLKGRLGLGGMGEVYLAEHVLLKQPCAVKLIRPEQAGDGDTFRRFEREVQATARLRHPNTVEIYDYGHAADGTFYYVMEYLPGLTLDELVGRYGPLPPARAVHLLRQVCGALREAHGMGLVHRDIKPANVIACERGGLPDVAKLLDFGLVKELGPDRADPALTREGTVAGTPMYMSPEQAAGGRPLDARSDIYSLGAVAYFLLTGRPPFPERSPVEILAAHLYETPRSPAELRPEVPAALADVVLRCLAKEPADRFPDAAALDHALAACPGVAPWDPDAAAAWWRAHELAPLPPVLAPLPTVAAGPVLGRAS